MSGYTTGLTNINKPSEVDITHSELQKASVLQPSKDTVNGLAVKKEIEELIKERESIKEDIYKIIQQRNNENKQLTSELKVLKRQKIQMLREVKSISSMLFTLKEVEDEKKVNFEDFFAGREDILVNFASATSQRIKKGLKELEERTETLINQENNVIEMMNYSSFLLEASYNASNEVAEAKKQLEVEAKEIFKQTGEINLLKSKTLETFMKANDDMTKAKLTLGDSREKMKKADEYVEEHKGKLLKKIEDVKRTEIRLKVKEAFQKKETIRLTELERFLKDKEGAIRRLAIEVKKWQR